MRISDWSSDVCSSDLEGPDVDTEHRSEHGDSLQCGDHQHTGAEQRLAEPSRWLLHDLRVNLLGLEDDRAGRVDDQLDRKRVVVGKSVSVRVDLGGRRIHKKKYNNKTTPQPKHT